MGAAMAVSPMGSLPLMGPALCSNAGDRLQELHSTATLTAANLPVNGSHGTAASKQLPGSYGSNACVPECPVFLSHSLPIPFMKT